MILSIIIPVYNVEAYLAECLDSVFNQFIVNCEVIAVNDGSTDNSRKILAEYQIKYPEFIIIDQINKGLSGARNAGINYASGEYLYFLDSDDYLLPNAITTILNAIESTRAEVIGFNATVNVDTVYIPSFIVNDKPKTGIDYFADFYVNNKIYPPFNVWLYTYKTAFLENSKHAFKEGILHEDVFFTLLTFYYSKSVFTYNYTIVNYRQQREGSISTDVKLKNLTDRTSICRDLDTFFKSKKFSNKHFYAILFQQYLFNLQLAVKNNFTSSLNLFFTTDDKSIMKKGISNIFEYKLWFLASIDIKIMDKYLNNDLSDFQRKIINIIGTILYK